MADSHGVFGFQVGANYHDVYEFNVDDCPNPRRDSSVRNSVLGANNSLRALHLQAQRVGSDPFLTPDGKTEKLALEQAKAAAHIARERSWLPKAVRDLAADEEALFSPGEQGDSKDEERRAWYDALDVNTREGFEAQAREGKHPDLVKALARSPVPGRAGAFGRECWRADVEKKNAAGVRALKTRRREVEWAQASLDAMARVVASDPWSTKRAESAVDRLTRGHAGRKVA
jgi:hypothetical protein